MAGALGLLIALHGTPANWDDTRAAMYAKLLGDLPPDLLVAGVEDALRRIDYFPKPSEIRRSIEGDLADRRHAARRLELALSRATSQRNPRT